MNITKKRNKPNINKKEENKIDTTPVLVAEIKIDKAKNKKRSMFSEDQMPGIKKYKEAQKPNPNENNKNIKHYKRKINLANLPNGLTVTRVNNLGPSDNKKSILSDDSQMEMNRSQNQLANDQKKESIIEINTVANEYSSVRDIVIASSKSKRSSKTRNKSLKSTRSSSSLANVIPKRIKCDKKGDSKAYKIKITTSTQRSNSANNLPTPSSSTATSSHNNAIHSKKETDVNIQYSHDQNLVSKTPKPNKVIEKEKIIYDSSVKKVSQPVMEVEYSFISPLVISNSISISKNNESDIDEKSTPAKIEDISETCTLETFCRNNVDNTKRGLEKEGSVLSVRPEANVILEEVNEVLRNANMNVDINPDISITLIHSTKDMDTHIIKETCSKDSGSTADASSTMSGNIIKISYSKSNQEQSLDSEELANQLLRQESEISRPTQPSARDSTSISMIPISAVNNHSTTMEFRDNQKVFRSQRKMHSTRNSDAKKSFIGQNPRKTSLSNGKLRKPQKKWRKKLPEVIEKLGKEAKAKSDLNSGQLIPQHSIMGERFQSDVHGPSTSEVSLQQHHVCQSPRREAAIQQQHFIDSLSHEAPAEQQRVKSSSHETSTQQQPHSAFFKSRHHGTPLEQNQVLQSQSREVDLQQQDFLDSLDLNVPPKQEHVFQSSRFDELLPQQLPYNLPPRRETSLEQLRPIDLLVPSHEVKLQQQRKCNLQSRYEPLQLKDSFQLQSHNTPMEPNHLYPSPSLEEMLLEEHHLNSRSEPTLQPQYCYNSPIREASPEQQRTFHTPCFEDILRHLEAPFDQQPDMNFLEHKPLAYPHQSRHSGQTIVQSAWLSRSVPQSAIEVMTASLRPSSWKQYGFSLRKWLLFCQSHGFDVYNASVTEVILFLTHCYEAGAQYLTLKLHRSALSLLLGPHVGQDYRIARFIKGVGNLRPPRYDAPCDISTVLNNLGNNGRYPN